MNPQKTLARGIFLTLGLTVVIYTVVVLAALAAASREEISATSAPLALVFSRTTGLSPLSISLIAIVATVAILLLLALWLAVAVQCGHRFRQCARKRLFA